MNATVLDWLIECFPTAKRQTLRRMIQSGRVRINGRPARTARDEIRENAKVEVIDQSGAGDGKATAKRPSPLEVVFEDRDILVVHKPAGLLTSTTPREKRETLLEQVRTHVGKGGPETRVGLIHRLDRDASGLLVFSLNDTAYHSLKTQFFKHTVSREYAVIVHGVPTPSQGRIRSRLIERADGTVRSTDEHAAGQGAVSDYRVAERRKKLSLLRVNLLTGRKHQIRVHLSERGHPVVGDRVYGRKRDEAPRLMLAAVRLVLIHPRTGEPMTFEQPQPPEFEQILSEKKPRSRDEEGKARMKD